MSKCCVLSGRGLCDELITRPEESYQMWCVVVCDLKTSWMRRPGPTGGLLRKKRGNLSIPFKGLNKPWGFQEVEATRFQDNRHMKVVSLSALNTGHLYPQGNIPGTHFYYILSQPQGHSTAGRILSMKNFNDNIGNRTRGLLACRAGSQPTAPRGRGGGVAVVTLSADEHYLWLRMVKCVLPVM
jgi:hypothetical protein